MAVNTVLLDFVVPSHNIWTEKEEDLLKTLANYVKGLEKAHFMPTKDGGFLATYTGEKSIIISVRGFSQGLLTFSLEHFKDESEEALFNFQRTRKLEHDLAQVMKCLRSHALPSIRRGCQRYFPSSDERILEYDIDAVVFEENSPHQKIQIVHSKSLGNILILDGLQNLSEKDLIYTETLMQRGKEDYSGKEIVILGGGDGALLYELLKENPKHVLMLELDEAVMRGCREHMRSVCGDVLDNLKGPNYETIVGDCFITLQEMVKENRQVDYVFGDLTDIPVSTTPQGEAWDFIRSIINKSFKILKPTGKYMTHCCGVACPSALRMFEEQLGKLDEPVKYTMDTTFVPSFLEEWAFYQVWKSSTN